MEWMERAACTPSDLEVDDFFFEGQFVKNSPEYREAVRKAKRICMGCPVRDECLRFAVDNHITDGIWGGKTPTQRKNLRYPRKRINGKYVYVHTLNKETDNAEHHSSQAV